MNNGDIVIKSNMFTAIGGKQWGLYRDLLNVLVLKYMKRYSLLTSCIDRHIQSILYVFLCQINILSVYIHNRAAFLKGYMSTMGIKHT